MVIFEEPFQRRLYRRFERRQIVCNQEPHSIRVYAVVLVPEKVSKAAYVWPRNTGTDYFRSAT